MKVAPRFRRGPELAFAGATLAGFAAWAASSVTLPPGLIMPAVATVFLAFAAALAMVAWRREVDPDQVTYADVAGALTLIGVCAAATIDPDQLVRLSSKADVPSTSTRVRTHAGRYVILKCRRSRYAEFQHIRRRHRGSNSKTLLKQ